MKIRSMDIMQAHDLRMSWSLSSLPPLLLQSTLWG